MEFGGGRDALPGHNLAHHADGFLDSVGKSARAAQLVAAPSGLDSGPCDLVTPASKVPAMGEKIFKQPLIQFSSPSFSFSNPSLSKFCLSDVDNFDAR